MKPNLDNPKCPTCGAVSRKMGYLRTTFRASRRYHCNQCGKTFGILDPLVRLDDIEVR